MIQAAVPTSKERKPTERKPKKCKVCPETFTPRNSLHVVCSAHCGLQLASSKREKAERKETKAKLVAMETLPQIKKRAQTAFNGYIRARDRIAQHPCISSGRALDWSGNATDAGHYRSVGSAPHLRFNEDNCHSQSKHDNKYKGGNAVDYRIGLIARIGLARVEALESDNAARNYTREELIDLAAEYRRRTRELLK